MTASSEDKAELEPVSRVNKVTQPKKVSKDKNDMKKAVKTLKNVKVKPLKW